MATAAAAFPGKSPGWGIVCVGLMEIVGAGFVAPDDALMLAWQRQRSWLSALGAGMSLEDRARAKRDCDDGN